MPTIQGDDVRTGMLAGINALTDAVKITLGPRGRNVALPQKPNLYGADYDSPTFAGAPVLVTNDGVTIAKSIELADSVSNMGAQMLKEAAIAANDVAGDGTTTAIVLAQSLLQDAFRNIAAGAHPLALRRGMQLACEAIDASLQQQSVPVESQDDLARVAAVSCQDQQLGALVGQALFEVGREGVVNVDDSQRLETELDVLQGIVFDRGLAHPALATDQVRQTAELFNPYILLTDKKLVSKHDVLNALICAAEDGRDCLLVSDGIEGEALALILRNKLEGDMNVACVTAPEYGEGRRWRMEDIAVQTGGMFVTSEAGLNVRDVTREMLGSAERVVVTPSSTSIQGGRGDATLIQGRINQLRSMVENTDYEFNRARHAQRLAKFVSGVATIRVGGATEPELWERKMRVEDAVNAARVAREEGVVPGGGAALLAAVPVLERLTAGLDTDEQTGVRIAMRACQAPLRQIAENAGQDGGLVVATVLQHKQATGYDAARATYEDMLDAGIVDPLAVVHAALHAAFSVAGTALLTEAGATATASMSSERTA